MREDRHPLTDEETEKERSRITCPNLGGWLVAETESRQSGLEPVPYSCATQSLEMCLNNMFIKCHKG